MSTKRKPSPSDVSDDEWSFVAPCLTLMRLDVPQRDRDPRAFLNALRWIVGAGTKWRMLRLTVLYADLWDGSIVRRSTAWAPLPRCAPRLMTPASAKIVTPRLD